MSLARLRLILWLVVGLAALGMVVAIWRQSEDQQVVSTPIGTIGGPFTLTGVDGKPFASSRLNGKPAAIFFGFTHCPDICPTTLGLLAIVPKHDLALALFEVAAFLAWCRWQFDADIS